VSVFCYPAPVTTTAKNIVPKELHLQRKELASDAWKILTDYREYDHRNLPDDTGNNSIPFLSFSPHN
jgi:hypothetical protein